MRTLPIIVGFAVTAFAGLAQAEGLKTLPLPGLWENEAQVLINGKDINATMQQAQAAMMQNMDPEQRKQMEAMMKAQGDPNKSLECLTAKDIAEMADPRKALARADKESDCKIDVVSTSADTAKFKMSCATPDGFTGEGAGEYKVIDAKHTSFSWKGRGKMPGSATVIESSTNSKSRWISADCGDVKPSDEESSED